jgi:hypothetical protein
VIEVAIVRPGPTQGGMVHPYLHRRQGMEPVSYPSQALEEALGRTPVATPLLAPTCRSGSGSITPITYWLQYADPQLAPTCRSRSGSYAYSARSRTPFRSDGGQHSAVIADTVPR